MSEQFSDDGLTVPPALRKSRGGMPADYHDRLDRLEEMLTQVLRQTSPVVKPHDIYPRKFRDGDLNYGALTPVLDVLYGGVIGYAFLKIVTAAGEMFRTFSLPLTDSAKNAVAAALLLLFVLNYLIADLCESRLFNATVPYRGQARFSIDLLVVIVLLTAVELADRRSPWSLVALSVVFALGAAWAVALRRDAHSLFEWRYPRLVLIWHFAAAGALLTSFIAAGVYRGFDKPMGWVIVGFLWIGYLPWMAIESIFKEVFDGPNADFQLFPVSMVSLGTRKIVQSVGRADKQSPKYDVNTSRYEDA